MTERNNKEKNYFNFNNSNNQISEKNNMRKSNSVDETDNIFEQHENSSPDNYREKLFSNINLENLIDTKIPINSFSPPINENEYLHLNYGNKIYANSSYADNIRKTICSNKSLNENYLQNNLTLLKDKNDLEYIKEKLEENVSNNVFTPATTSGKYNLSDNPLMVSSPSQLKPNNRDSVSNNSFTINMKNDLNGKLNNNIRPSISHEILCYENINYKNMKNLNDQENKGNDERKLSTKLNKKRNLVKIFGKTIISVF